MYIYSICIQYIKYKELKISCLDCSIYLNNLNNKNLSVKR